MRWGRPTPADSATPLLAVVTPLREEPAFAVFSVDEGARISTASRGKAVSFPDRHLVCPPPCLGEGREHTVTEHVPHGEEGLMLLTDIFQE